MRCIRIYRTGSPARMQIEDIDELHPGLNQVCVKLYAIGVNPIDTYIRSGQYHVAVAFPHTLGFDAAGIIKAVGKNITRWKSGQRVFIIDSLTGTYAQEVLCNLDQIYPLPENISFDQGAAIGIPYGTAYRALFIKAKAKSQMSCLIHGASGGVGTALVQLAKMANLRIIATAGSKAGLKLVKNLGAQWVLNHNLPGYLRKIMPITKNKGVDLIFEMLANVNLSEDLKVVAYKGRIVIIGCRGIININPRDAMTRDATILGMLLKNAPALEKTKIYHAIIKGLKNGALNPVIGRSFPLEEAKLAHTAILKSRAYGKIILRP